MENIREFLEKEMDKRSWKQADLARAANLDSAVISNIINGRRRMGEETGKAIAHALNLPPEVVFRAANLLPQVPDLDPLTRQAEWLMGQLDPAAKQEAIDFIQFLADKQQRRQGAKQNNDATAQLGKPIPSAP